jgi:uncharacterized protein (TIGR02594 family)
MSTKKELVSAVQARLADLGYYRQPVDGMPGPATSNAIIDFKQAHGLRARSFVGQVTLSRLFDPAAKMAPKPASSGSDPTWLVEARRLLGTREVKGPGDNPRIMQWAKDLDVWYPGDDTAWCGLFVAHCLRSAGLPDAMPANVLGARKWLDYGATVEPHNVRTGSICVLWRTHKTKSWHGHVFFVTGTSADAIRGIGGNQSDNVTETWFPKSRLLGYRLPADVVPPLAPVASTGEISRRES